MSIMEKISSLLGGNKVDQSTGKTTAQNTEKAFTSDIAGLGTLVSSLGLDDGIVKKIEGLTSLDLTQIQSVLSTLGQSSDEQVQSAKADLETVKNDGESFAEKLKGYLTKLPQLLTLLAPTLEKLLGSK